MVMCMGKVFTLRCTWWRGAKPSCCSSALPFPRRWVLLAEEHPRHSDSGGCDVERDPRPRTGKLHQWAGSHKTAAHSSTTLPGRNPEAVALSHQHTPQGGAGTQKATDRIASALREEVAAHRSAVEADVLGRLQLAGASGGSECHCLFHSKPSYIGSFLGRFRPREQKSTALGGGVRRKKE